MFDTLLYAWLTTTLVTQLYIILHCRSLGSNHFHHNVLLFLFIFDASDSRSHFYALLSIPDGPFAPFLLPQPIQFLFLSSNFLLPNHTTILISNRYNSKISNIFEVVFVHHCKVYSPRCDVVICLTWLQPNIQIKPTYGVINNFKWIYAVFALQSSFDLLISVQLNNQPFYFQPFSLLFTF